MHDAHERRYGGGADRLRSPQRLERLEANRVVTLCLDALPGCRVVDIGSGPGVFAESFLARRCAVTGIDPNSELLCEARRLVPAAAFLLGIAERLPLAGKSFDLAFLGTVLHETDDAVAALREAGRVARHRVAVLEFPYLEEEEGPPLAHRLRPETIAERAHEAGMAHFARVTLRHMELYLMTP